MISIREIFLVGIRKAGSQDAFAREIGIDPAQLSRFMSPGEDSGLKMSVIDRACEYAGVTVIPRQEYLRLIGAYLLGASLYERTIS